MPMKEWWKEPMSPRERLIWNAAVIECQELVYSDGVELHPELVLLLEKAKKK